MPTSLSGSPHETLQPPRRDSIQPLSDKEAQGFRVDHLRPTSGNLIATRQVAQKGDLEPHFVQSVLSPGGTMVNQTAWVGSPTRATTHSGMRRQRTAPRGCRA